jgi:tetratricopeptide (TPR) repeat protein
MTVENQRYSFKPSQVALSTAAREAAAALAADPEKARLSAQRMLERAPNDPRALLILGSALRRLGDVQGARNVLAPLADAYPEAANTQYELGATLNDLGEPELALAAAERAVSLNRDLPEAWRLIGELLFREGDPEGAKRAQGELDRAAERDPRARSAAQALLDRDLNLAEQRLQSILSTDPNNAAALRMLAEVSASQGRHNDAETLLAYALSIEPSDRLRFEYATALFHQQKTTEALEQARLLVAAGAYDPAYQNLLAACLGLAGEHAEVVEIYQALLARFVNHPGIWLNYGHALRTLGRREAAIQAYRHCIALKPGFGEAFWALANLKVAPFSLEDEASMVAEIDRPGVSISDQIHFHYALGKVLEDRADYAGSFSHYQRGAEVRRRQRPYDANLTTDIVRRSKALFTSDFFEARSAVGASSAAPIFIVGLPRAGSTLIEQILASHSEVEGTMELPDIHLIATSLGHMAQGRAGLSYPEDLAEYSASQFADLGARYLSRTSIYRKLGKRHFVDKMPNNFQHLGLIRLILPNAKIIDARRHPLASCFSAYKQHFNQGQDFTYALSDIGSYYKDYIDLMNHYERILPNWIYRVVYEDVVENTEVEIRRLLNYCGLPFEEACLKFYHNERAVRTVSSEQVRRPIFRDGLHQWRNYEPWLDPLKESLGPALRSWKGGVW